MNREQRRALGRTSARTQAVGSIDVAAMQAEVDELRSIRTGSYALIHTLVSRLGGGPIDIPRAEWKALPPKEKLGVKVDPDTNDVRLWIEHETGERSVEGL